ncbi:MAG TPA: uracil-DNA glycosylase [Myxococcota bacterium]|nr:uracil-DNA glycosylase [Myxococcota bacterium]
MSVPADPRSVLRSVVASARACVEELAEEGVDAFEPLAAPAIAPASAPPRAAAAPRSTTSSGGTATVALPERPSLEEVRDVLGECRRCRLCEGRTQIVFGDGNPRAEILFVGEGPGEQEDLRGMPFCGRAGELLTSMIEKGMGVSRRDVYICNVVKCRPPGNRTPLPDEVAACRPFLDGQIQAIRPKVIVALGKPAASLLLGRDIAITKVRGTWHEYRGIPVMPTLHPAYVLRQYTPENRRLVWEDLKAALAKSREA